MKKDSWLVSDSFLKRAFAIWGYHFVANIIIMIPIMILWFAFVAMIVGMGISQMNHDGYNDRGMMMDGGMMENGGAQFDIETR
jgi:hypothetical protein